MEDVTLFLKAKFVPLMFMFLSSIFMFLIKTLADRIGAWASSFATARLDEVAENLKSKTSSEAVKAGIEEARAVLHPRIAAVAMTSTKLIKEMAADGRITQEEAIQALAKLGSDMKAEARLALADWKERMKPIIADPDKVIDALVEEGYQIVKRNFELGSSKPA